MAIAQGKAVQVPRLKPNDSWTDEYFTLATLKLADRLRFSGQ